MPTSRLLIIGNPEEYSVGHFLQLAAREEGLDVTFEDSRNAYTGTWIRRKWNWYLRGHLPAARDAFSNRLVEQIPRLRPDWILATGIAPLTSHVLETARAQGVTTLNYLTDDPWNRAHFPPWFFPTLPLYDVVHTTRRANIRQLESLGCRAIVYTPFAFSPAIHFPESPRDASTAPWDVFFAGGADPDRVPTISALAKAGFSIGLYGDLWERYRETRPFGRGFLLPPEMRQMVARSKVHLGLVRRANRDGQAMRTFELAAMGACLIVEDTEEHREIFGTEGAGKGFALQEPSAGRPSRGRDHHND